MDFILIFWICCGIAAAMVASSKGRDTGGWFVLGLLLGPFGLIFALIVSKEGPAQDERKCPFCAEYVKREAVVCKHCGRDLPSTQDRSDDAFKINGRHEERQEYLKKQDKIAVTIIIILFSVALIAWATKGFPLSLLLTNQP